jgi:hypothetical protein
MEFDRRALLVSLASTAAMLAVPGTAAAAFEPESFAASRRDDRGNFSAALFTLGGDIRAVELPQRGHDITLKPDGTEWVAFARRPGRFGVAIPLDARPPVWFASKPDRHFFGPVCARRMVGCSAIKFDYAAAGVIGVRDASAGHRSASSAPGMEPHDSRSFPTAAPWSSPMAASALIPTVAPTSSISPTCSPLSSMSM